MGGNTADRIGSTVGWHSPLSIQLRGMDSRIRPYAEYALDLATYYGISPTITSVYRSWEEQTRLRTAYERGESRWPANRPGDSSHNYGWAFDSVVPAADQDLWNEIRRYVGFEVLPGDIIHGQVPNWRQYRESGFQRVV